MPIVSYFVVAGTALLALLFYADAHLEHRGPLPISSEFAGLPKVRHVRPEDPVMSLVAPAAPAPDMHSAAVLAAAPPPEPDAKAEAGPAKQTAKAEPAPRKKRHVARRPPPQPDAPRFAWRGGSNEPFGLPLFGRF